MQITPYPDVNKILDELTQGIVKIVKENLIGFYLTGSLSYGNFNPKSSDIDLHAVIKYPFSKNELESIKKLHEEIEMHNKTWKERIECSYTPLSMFQNILPPKLPRPYYGAGIFYPEAPYGNEWLINNYLLYKHGIALTGPDFKTLIKPIDMVDVQKACVRDLFKEWEPKINDRGVQIEFDISFTHNAIIPDQKELR